MSTLPTFLQGTQPTTAKPLCCIAPLLCGMHALSRTHTHGHTHQGLLKPLSPLCASTSWTATPPALRLPGQLQLQSCHSRYPRLQKQPLSPAPHMRQCLSPFVADACPPGHHPSGACHVPRHRALQLRPVRHGAWACCCIAPLLAIRSKPLPSMSVTSCMLWLPHLGVPSALSARVRCAVSASWVFIDQGPGERQLSSPQVFGSADTQQGAVLVTCA